MYFFHRFHKIRYKQYVCVIIVSLLQTCISTTSAWVSPTLPLLLSDDTPLHHPLTDNEESWLISAEKLGSLIGSILAAFVTDRIGRKKILLLASVPFILGTVVTAFNKIVVVLLVVRLATGLAMGIVYAILPVYISEISDKDIRGRLGIMQIIIGTFGKMFVYNVGPFISYFALSLSLAIFPTVFFVLFVFMPESPYHLVKQGNSNGAKKSLQQISVSNVTKDELKSKLNEIEVFVVGGEKKINLIRTLIFDRASRKAFFYALALITIYTFSGLFVVYSYLQTFIEDSGSSISPELTSVIIGVISLPSALLAAYLVDKVGRKPLFLISTSGCAAAIIAEGIYFYLKENGNVSDILWLPTAGLCVFIVFGYLGISTVPGVMQGEMFSINVKAVGSSLVAIHGSASAFVLFKFLQPMANKWGMHVMFWIYGGVCLVGFLFGVFVLPETKGKTFTEIQEMLYGRQHKKFEELKVEK